MDKKKLNADIGEQLDRGYKNIQEMMSAPLEDYVTFLTASTIGEMSGFRALLEQELTRVEVSVQELQTTLQAKQPTEQELATFGSLYGYVFRISDRLMMLHMEIKARMASLNEEIGK